MKQAIITGGEGDLAMALAVALRSLDWEMLSPGRGELDVSCEKSVQKYFGKLEELDLLIHAAGGIEDKLLVSMEEGAWNRVVEAHLKGAFLCSREAVRLMRKSGGVILFIGSHSGMRGKPGQANYSAAKAGLIGLAQSIAKEWGKRNIRCNVVCPGYLETKLNRGISEKARQMILQEHCLGRFNTLKESARMIAQIAELENVSGQVFQLDSRVGAWT